MTTPSIVQAKKTHQAGAASISTTFDAAPTQGNLLLVFVIAGEETAANWTPPSGYTLVAERLRASNTSRVFGKLAGASEASTVVTATTGIVGNGPINQVLVEVQNTAATIGAAIGSSTSNNSATSVTAIAAGASAISTSANSLIFAAVATDSFQAAPTVSDSFVRYTTIGTGYQDIATLATSSASSVNTTFTYGSAPLRLVSVLFEVKSVAVTGLTITSVTPSSFDSGITGIVIAGSGFGASQGSSTVDIGGQAQTVTNWATDGTSITVTSARGSNSMGTGQLKVTIR